MELNQKSQKLEGAEAAAALLAALIMFSLIFSVVTLIIAYFLMLFLGNLGTELSYIGSLPGAALISILRIAINYKKE